MSKPYKTCPDCGNHLDPGEHCDCEKEAKPKAAEAVHSYAGSYADKPVSAEPGEGNPRKPALAYGA